MESYYNDLIAGKRFQLYTNPGVDPLPAKTPNFQNRHLSGYATYRCFDNDPTTLTSTDVTCEIAARASNYKWDTNQSLMGVKLELFRPYIMEETLNGGLFKALDEHRYLDDNCIMV